MMKGVMGQQISYLTVIVVHSTMHLMHHNHCQITTMYMHIHVICVLYIQLLHVHICTCVSVMSVIYSRHVHVLFASVHINKCALISIICNR